MKNKLFFFLAGVCCCVSLSLSGCGGGTKTSVSQEAAAEAPREEMYYEDEVIFEEAGSSEMKDTIVQENGQQEENEVTQTSQRKLIKTVNFNLETENYEELMKGLEQEIIAMGGYIEYKDAYHGDYYNYYGKRRANITARIPAGRLEEFKTKASGIGNITYESESVEDVTLQYVDLSSHKKMLVAQQERLMELLQTAQNMEELITLESRLSEVRYQIESMESQLRTFDNQVDYSTVHIEVEEVERYTPQPEKSAWDRIRTGFLENVYRVTNGIKNFGIEFIIAIPVLIVWAAVITVLVILAKTFLNRKNKDKKFFVKKRNEENNEVRIEKKSEKKNEEKTEEKNEE